MSVAKEYLLDTIAHFAHKISQQLALHSEDFSQDQVGLSSSTSVRGAHVVSSPAEELWKFIIGRRGRVTSV